MKKGIDISKYQNYVEFNKLKAQGIEFVIIRDGYGKNLSQKDQLFEDHYRKAKENGLRVGCYHYSYATTIEGAKLEAYNCLEFIKGKKFEYPVFYDLEDEVTTGKENKEKITLMALEFCKIIKEAGFIPRSLC